MTALGDKATRKVLAHLAEFGPTAASVLAAAVWPRQHLRRQFDAALLLERMRRQGLISVLTADGASQWIITDQGRSLLQGGS